MYVMLGVLATSTDGVRNNIMVSTLNMLNESSSDKESNERDCAMTDILKWLLALTEPSAVG